MQTVKAALAIGQPSAVSACVAASGELPHINNKFEWSVVVPRKYYAGIFKAYLKWNTAC